MPTYTIGDVEAAFMYGWDAGYAAGSHERLRVVHLDPDEARGRDAEKYMARQDKAPPPPTIPPMLTPEHEGRVRAEYGPEAVDRYYDERERRIRAAARVEKSCFTCQLCPADPVGDSCAPDMMGREGVQDYLARSGIADSDTGMPTDRTIDCSGWAAKGGE